MKIFSSYAVVLGLSLLANASQGATEYYYMTVPNNTLTPPTDTYAEVKLEDIAIGKVQFTVTMCGDNLIAGQLNCNIGAVETEFSDATLDGFYFVGPEATVDVVNPADWTFDFDNNSNTSIFGSFNVNANGGTSTNQLIFTLAPLAGQGPLAIADYVNPSDPTGNKPSYYFSADITGGDAKGAHIGALVPIPAAAWLFGSGLIGLAAIARKRKAS